MPYLDAYRFVFRRPEWFKNLMLLSVCMLIPLVGPLAVMGWMRDVFLALREDRTALCPAFSFDRFGDYIGRGVWPFLVGLVAGVVMVPVLWVIMGAGVLTIAFMKLRGPEVVLAILPFAVVYLVAVTLFTLLLVPLQLRALLMQDFGGAFNAAFLKDFLGRIFWQLLAKQFVLMLSAIPMALAGEMCCIIGIFPAMVIINIAGWVMTFDVYEEYLRRGGIEIPIKPLSGPAPVRAFEVGPGPGASL